MSQASVLPPADAPNGALNGQSHIPGLGPSLFARPWKSVIPTVDLSQDDLSTSDDIRNACIKFGFFTIQNHGIDARLIEDMFEVNRAFFALPVEEKLKIKTDKNFRGYTPMKEETLDPKNATSPDTKEGLYFGREVPEDDPEAQSTPLIGPNQWPSEESVPGYRATTEAYMAAMIGLGNRLVRLLALALRLPKDFFDEHFVRPMAFLRPLHYSAEQSDPAKGLFAAGAHSDYGMLTILKTTRVGGLQIHLDGTWIDVDPVDGFIVNLGDMLERWSNCLFRSTIHRVISKGHDRYSIPFFFEPSFHTRVECLPQCCSVENPARYPPTTSGQHLLDKYGDTHSSYAPDETKRDPADV